MESKQKSSECVLVIPELNPKPAEEGNQEAANLFSSPGSGLGVLSTLESWSEGKTEPGNWFTEQAAKSFFKFAVDSLPFLPKKAWRFHLQRFTRAILIEGHRFN